MAAACQPHRRRPQSKIPAVLSVPDGGRGLRHLLRGDHVLSARCAVPAAAGERELQSGAARTAARVRNPQRDLRGAAGRQLLARLSLRFRRSRAAPSRRDSRPLPVGRAVPDRAGERARPHRPDRAEHAHQAAEQHDGSRSHHGEDQCAGPHVSLFLRPARRRAGAPGPAEPVGTEPDCRKPVAHHPDDGVLQARRGGQT